MNSFLHSEASLTQAPGPQRYSTALHRARL